jgi:hypothetical protein
MSKNKSRKRRLKVEGKNFDCFTKETPNHTIIAGFQDSGEKHITIIQNDDSISSHLTTPEEHKHLLRVSNKKVIDTISLKGRIIQPESSWELWSPKEYMISITHKLIEKNKIPAKFAEDAKKHFESVIINAIKYQVLELLFDRITYSELLSGMYSFAYKIDSDQKVTGIIAKTENEAIEIELFSCEAEDLLRGLLGIPQLFEATGR